MVQTYYLFNNSPKICGCKINNLYKVQFSLLNVTNYPKSLPSIEAQVMSRLGHFDPTRYPYGVW